MPQSSSPASSCQCRARGFTRALLVLHAPRCFHPPFSVAPSGLPTDANHPAHAPTDEPPTAREAAAAANDRLPIRAAHCSTASNPPARYSRPRAVDRIPRPGAAAGPSLPRYRRNIAEGVPPQRCIRRAALPARKLLPAWLPEKRVDSYALHGLRMVLVPALSPLNARRAHRFTNSHTQVQPMTGRQDTVFLFDVDNTLLDNDAVQKDLSNHLESEFGRAARERYWAIFETLRAELGYADYLGALQRYRSE